MAYAATIDDIQPFQPKTEEPISAQGGVAMVLTARLRAIDVLAGTSEFWRRSVRATDPGSLPHSLLDTDEITWGLDDEDEYQVVAMRDYVEPSIDEGY